MIDSLTAIESRFTLDNNTALITPLIGHVHQNLSRMKFGDEIGLIRIGVAIREAIINAIHHGNLEVSSELREPGDDDSYYDLVEERIRLRDPYRDRRVRFIAKRVAHRGHLRHRRRRAPASTPPPCPTRPTPPTSTKEFGRGLLLIRTFMDEVHHNARGNEITMIKRREAR